MDGEICDCQVCRTIREAFQLQSGEEIKHINRLVESLKHHALCLNDIANLLDNKRLFLNEKLTHVNNVLNESIKHTNDAIMKINEKHQKIVEENQDD